MQLLIRPASAKASAGKKIIVALLIPILLISQAPKAYAIYSPTLSDSVSIIKENVRSSREQNGVGSFLNAYDKVAQANEGLLMIFVNSLKELIIDSLLQFFYDDWSLLVNRWWGTNVWITNCLRDDIWELKALQEEVLNELFKAALLSDMDSATVLWDDYQEIEAYLKELKEDYADTNYWFPGGLPNYYTQCPYGDFQQAFKELKLSWDQLMATFGGESLVLGGLEEMAEEAERRGKARAARWIAANKLRLTFGGEQGASRRSLLSGPGLEGLAADFQTQWEYVWEYGKLIAKSTLDAFVESFKGRENIETIAQAYEDVHEAQELTMNRMETALTYNLNLSNVSEQSLINIEKTLFEINLQIQRAFTTKIDDTGVLRDFCNKLSTLAKVQCKNKSGEAPSCK